MNKWLYGPLYGSMDDFDKQAIEDNLNLIDKNTQNINNNMNQQVEINTKFNETFVMFKQTMENERPKIVAKLDDINN